MFRTVSGALVDAVFRFRPGREEQPAASVERYRRHFGVARRRADDWELPAADEQETLTELMSHYEELGIERMANEVFRCHNHFPGTVIERAEHVLNVASALHAIEVDTLHDVRARRPTVIGQALERLPGVEEEFVRTLLMYASDDDFVWGDEHVRSFVARALERNTIPTQHAANLVRGSAYELVLSPRYLDYHIRLAVTATHASTGEAPREQ